MAGTGDKLMTAAEIKEVTDTKVNLSDIVPSVYSASDVFTAQSGGTIKTNYSYATKMASACYMQLNVTAASSGSLITVAEVKDGFFPYGYNKIFTMAIDESDNSVREVIINGRNGSISIYNAVSGHTYNISLVYFVR